jgi:hypothetical protein
MFTRPGHELPELIFNFSTDLISRTTHISTQAVLALSSDRPDSVWFGSYSRPILII